MRILLRPVNVLLIAGPIGLISVANEWGNGLTFILLALSVIPLAGLIAGFTDSIADRLGDRVGGLLEAGLGNAAFIIIGVISLSRGLDTLVRASIAGAIISNTLFVLGMAFFIGTSRGVRQKFNPGTGTSYSKLLALTVVALVMPALAPATGNTRFDISLISAVVLILLFVAYLLFDIFHFRDLAYLEVNQLKGEHISGKQTEDQSITIENASVQEYRAEEVQAAAQRTTTHSARRARAQESHLNPIVALVGLVIALIITVYFSETLVSVTEELTTKGAHFTIGAWDLGTFQLSELFVGLVVIPLIGTAAEHLSAIRSASDGRTEITIAVTAGAAIQVALLAAPLFVIVSIFLGGSRFDLFFNRFELAAFGLATFLFYLVTEDGEGSWLEGIQLLAFYFIFAGAALFIPA